MVLAFFGLIVAVSLLQSLLLMIFYNDVMFFVFSLCCSRCGCAFTACVDKVGPNCVKSLTKYQSLRFTA